MPTSDDPPSYQFTPVCQRVLPEQRANVTYELILRQQPKQSRMCGVGEKADRRPIDPPPIVQLIVKTPPGAKGGPFTSFLQNPYYFMHASLVEKDTREDVLLIKDTRSKDDMHLYKDNRTKATTGSSVSSLYPLKDVEDNGTESGFFVFPDLSVRMEGTYRLKFCLYEMVGKDVHFCACITSDPLIVYSAKKFPGMEESTPLSQHFAEQGLKIRIRKEVRPKKRTRAEYLPAPTSASPKESQRDELDPSESHDEEEKDIDIDTSQASKRRASGTKAVKEEAQQESGQMNAIESRSSSSQRGIAWRQHSKDLPVSTEKPRPSPDISSQQKGYSEDVHSGLRRSSATNRATEGMSHMNLNAGPSSGSKSNSNTRSEQWMDEYRNWPQDHISKTQDRINSTSLPSRHGHTNPHAHPVDVAMDGLAPTTAASDGQSSEQMVLDPPVSSHYSPAPMPLTDATRARIGIQECNGPVENGASTTTAYSRQPTGPHQEDLKHTLQSSQGIRSPPRHSKDHQGSSYSAHNQSFPARGTSSETSYTYPPRQGYANSSSFRPLDYGAPGSFPEDHHRGSDPYERSDYSSRSQADAPSHHTAPFHTSARPSHYPPPPGHDQQHLDIHANEQQSVRSRPPSYHDSSTFKQQMALDPPHPLSHGKYHAADGSEPLHPHNMSKYPSTSKNELAPPSHARYPSHGHSSYSSNTAVSKEQSYRKLSLTTSPPRPHEHRSQSLPHLTHVAPQPKGYGHSPGEGFPSGGYGDLREYDIDTAPRQPTVEQPMYQDGSAQSLASPQAGGYFARSNPPSGPYPGNAQESTSSVGHGTGSRASSIEYGPDGRPLYGHGRSMSSSNIHRPSYPPGSTSSAGVRSGNPPTGAGQIRGPYDDQDGAQGGHAAKAFPATYGSDHGYRVHNGTRGHQYDSAHSVGPVTLGLAQSKGPIPPQPHPQHEPHSQHSLYQRQPQVQYHDQTAPPHLYQHYPDPPTLTHNSPPSHVHMSSHLVPHGYGHTQVYSQHNPNAHH
ncbi:velvet factor-domain-containing protein [Mortierella sp. GBAus27b]|nr:velvet factor-domain-containing protein [Mortierella sp. GBAus27b]